MFSSLLKKSSIFSQRNHLNYNNFFMFYADHVLSLLSPPPFPDVNTHYLKCYPQPGKLLIFLAYVQFSFVRYSVYIIPVYRVIIQKSSCDTSCTPLCIPCINSDQQYLQTVFNSANIRGILPKNTQTDLNQEYKSHNLVYDFRQSTAINR